MGKLDNILEEAKMPQITIIGLGLIGGSLGMALRQAYNGKAELVGYDSNSKAHNSAKKAGIVDRTEWNLDKAVENADVVVLAVPVGATPEIFKAIGPYLKEGATITDTASTKREVLGWANEILPESVGFVGGHPLAGSGLSGSDAATPSLFTNKKFAVISSAKAPQSSVGQVLKIVDDIGSSPFFLSADEHDSFVAAVAHLPAVISTALVSAIAKSPSWREMGKFASDEFGDMSRLAGVDPEVNHGLCRTNPDMIVYWINQMISELQDWRSMIVDENRNSSESPLMNSFINAWEARARWSAGIDPVDFPQQEIPTAGDSMMSMLLGGHMASRLSSMTKDDGQDSTRYRGRRRN